MLCFTIIRSRNKRNIFADRESESVAILASRSVKVFCLDAVKGRLLQGGSENGNPLALPVGKNVPLVSTANNCEA